MKNYKTKQNGLKSSGIRFLQSCIGYKKVKTWLIIGLILFAKRHLCIKWPVDVIDVIDNC